MFSGSAVVTIRACQSGAKIVSQGAPIMEFAAAVLFSTVVLWFVEEATDDHL
jgi:hypothetical protein